MASMVFALFEGDEFTPRFAGVELTRARDALLGVGKALIPLGQPADAARDGKDHREHVAGDANRSQDDPRVEVDVRVQLAL